MTGVTVSYSVSFGGGRRRREKGEPAEEPETAEHGPTTTTSVARRLALAHHVERLIDEGILADYAHAARILGVSRPRMTQLMDLLLLAPEVQERVLTGRLCVSERTLRLMAGQPDWRVQDRASCRPRSHPAD